MKSFGAENSKLIIVHSAIVGVIALFSFVRHDYKAKEVSFFQSVLIETLSPIQRGTVSIKESVGQMVENYLSIVDTNKDNSRLQHEVVELRSQLFNLEEILKENERLKELLEFGKDIPRKKILAQIVGWDSSSEFKVLRINKGKNSKIRLRDPVITSSGVVGYIYRVTDNFADILTILDQNNRADVIVSRTRSHAIVEGMSQDRCRLKYVARTEQIEVGDEVITAGLGRIYPKGLKIGRITKIDRENFGITQSVEITPSVDFTKLEEVVVFVAEDDTGEVN